MSSDDEAALAAFLNGKFFWEPTTTKEDLLDSYASKDVLDIRKAQKAFAKDAQNVTTKKKVTKSTAPIKLQDRVLRGEEKIMEPVLKAISEVYGFTIKDLLGESKVYKFANAKKHLVWALFRYIPGMTTLEAGRLLKRCHTTVIYNRDRFDANKHFEKVAEVDVIMGRV